MAQNPCVAPVVAVVADAVVRGVVGPVVVVAEAHRGVAAVAVVVVAEVRAAAAARDVPHLQVNGEVPRRGASPFASK